MENKEILFTFSDLLSYPERKYNFNTHQWRIFVQWLGVEEGIANEIEAYFTKNDLINRQEQYVQFFDLQSVNHLYTGYALLGEDLRRGMLLAHLKKEMHEHGIDLHNELPDYLPKLLQLLAVHGNDDFIRELNAFLILPALDRLVESFTPREHVFTKILVILREYLSKVNQYPISHVNSIDVSILK